MRFEEIMEQADERIELHRKSDATIRVTDWDGKPAPGVRVEVEQTRHEFLFGANIFPLFDYKDDRHELYGRRFTDLLNYATLPFYWGSYEPSQGDKQIAHLTRLAKWCGDHGVTTKGHPLVWHEVYPEWAPSDPDEARKLLKARVQEIIPHYAGLIDIWDVVNEATVAVKFDNAVGKWAARDGDAGLVDESLHWAREAGPGACLVYNDYNISSEFEKLAGELVARKSPFDVIGIQSHMFGSIPPHEHYWQACEAYSRFGKPLHFTEITVLSGELGWNLPTPWDTTPEGEARQADYVPTYYKMLFSHPAVEAATWWDLVDGCWQHAPGGLIRADLSPKPAYEQLMTLIKGEWWTKTDLQTDERGECRFRGIRGDYKVTSGTVEQRFSLGKGPNEWLTESA